MKLADLTFAEYRDWHRELERVYGIDRIGRLTVGQLNTLIGFALRHAADVRADTGHPASYAEVGERLTTCYTSIDFIKACERGQAVRS